MLYNILLIVQIVVSVAMIVLILMQHGKGADAGAAFGSGASGTVFGSRGSGNFLSRTTAILATVFFVNCIALAWIVSHRSTTPTSIMDNAAPTGITAPKVETAPVPAVLTNSEVPAVPEQSAPTGSEVLKTEAAPTANAAPATSAEVPVAPTATETKPATPAASGETATTEPKKP